LFDEIIKPFFKNFFAPFSFWIAARQQLFKFPAPQGQSNFFAPFSLFSTASLCMFFVWSVVFCPSRVDFK
jgi:hypothetical protein